MAVRMGCTWAGQREPNKVEKSVAVWVIFAAYWTVVVMAIYRMAAWKGYYLVDWKDVSMENWKVGQMDCVLLVELMVVY